jgi:hypothetical protein
MSLQKAFQEECRGSPNERPVAATTTKQRKHHTLTLAWPEEAGQYLSIGQGGTPVSISPAIHGRPAARGDMG